MTLREWCAFKHCVRPYVEGVLPLQCWRRLYQRLAVTHEAMMTRQRSTYVLQHQNLFRRDTASSASHEK